MRATQNPNNCRCGWVVWASLGNTAEAPVLLMVKTYRASRTPPPKAMIGASVCGVPGCFISIC